MTQTSKELLLYCLDGGGRCRRIAEIGQIAQAAEVAERAELAQPAQPGQRRKLGGGRLCRRVCRRTVPAGAGAGRGRRCLMLVRWCGRWARGRCGSFRF